MKDKVTAFLDKYNLRTDPSVRYIDLVSEVGELGKELIKATDYGKKGFVRTDETVGEIGDCLFALFALSYELGVDMPAALDVALAKYERRFKNKGNCGS
ncbi:MAG: hypothetical protein FWC95_01480 [Defluviitaleaceae bacterium]|nr:hypothetical protein [Defluviitaleaceae bacterium]